MTEISGEAGCQGPAVRQNTDDDDAIESNDFKRVGP